MGELEPTITEHEPTATERLRALLDERGEYYKTSGNRTLWGRPIDAQTGKPIPHVYHYRATEMGDGRLFLEAQLIAPEQAIAATLGSCNCSNDCTNSERTETCHPVISDNLTESEGTGDAWADCSECGHLLFVLTDPNSQVPNFCPNCGKRIEVDDG